MALKDAFPLLIVPFVVVMLCCCFCKYRKLRNKRLNETEYISPQNQFQPQHYPWQQPQLQSSHYTLPQHANLQFPYNPDYYQAAPPYVLQQQPGGSEHLYAQAPHPGMSGFPEPPPPYETNPLLPPQQK